MTQADRSALAEYFRLEAVGLGEIGSPFYAELERLMADDVERGGPVWDVLESRARRSTTRARLPPGLGGVHRMVLAPAMRRLATHYPVGRHMTVTQHPHGGTCEDLRPLPPEVLECTLARPPQTNEVGRWATLCAGVPEVAKS